jgi:DNA end-binding protein Ku
MPRAAWEGSISFGLVNIPVAVYSAEDRAEKISFNMLDGRDMSPVGYQRINKETGEPVPWDDIVKGYEIEDGRYVIVTEEDFKKANPRASRTVEILDFVDAEDIDPAFLETPYYLAPAKNGAKAYAVLREALKRSGKAGIAKVVMRTKQHLAAVMPRGDALMLELLRFAHELRDPKKLDLPPESAASSREVEMAEKLVKGMSSRWQPSKYRDDYTQDLLALIEKKAKHGDVEEVEDVEDAVKPTNVVDLMPLLKKSLEEAESRGSSSSARRKAPAARRKAAPKRKAAASRKKAPARRRSA